MSSLPIIFVTGASGFVGSHIVYQLLEAGYPVRGAARGRKLELLTKVFSKYKNFTPINVPDISAGDLSVALRDVEAVIHTAMPQPGAAPNAETAIKKAVDGSVHFLREALKAGVKKAIITGSSVTFAPDGPWGVNDYNKLTLEDALNGDHYTAYFVEKTLADIAIAEFADAHPELDVTTLAPPFVFGPFIPGFEQLIPSPDFQPFSTNGFIYALLRPDNVYFPSSARAVDVRDVARAHIAALKSLPSSQVGRKRFMVMAPYAASYSDAIKYIADERPELKDRLVPLTSAPTFQPPREVDPEGLAKVVGITPDSYIPWRRTILDTVDSLIAIEQFWKENGHQFDMPTTAPFEGFKAG